MENWYDVLSKEELHAIVVTLQFENGNFVTSALKKMISILDQYEERFRVKVKDATPNRNVVIDDTLTLNGVNWDSIFYNRDKTMAESWNDLEKRIKATEEKNRLR